MNNQFKKTTSLVLASYLVSLLSIPIPAFAILPPDLAETADIKYSVQCEDFCPKFGKKGSSGGLTSGSIWGTADDALCADMGAPTSSAYPKASPTPHPSFASCSVPVTQSFLTLFGATDTIQGCIKAGEVRDHCTFHNSQVETHCMAFNAIEDRESGAYKLNGALLAMDTLAAATCLAACVTLNVVAESACAIAGAGVGAGEMITMITQSTGAAAEFIQTQDYIAGAAGGVAMAGGAGVAGATYNQSKVSDRVKDLAKKAKDASVDAAKYGDEVLKADKAIQEAVKVLESGADDTAKNAARVRKATNEATKEGAEAMFKQKKELADQASKELAEAGGKQADTISRGMACGEAALFATMVGIRTYNLATMKKLKNDSCKKVNKLFSEASGTNTNSTGDNSTNNSVSAGGNDGSTTGGNNSTASTSAVQSPDQLESYSRCRGTGSTVDDCMKASGISTLAQTGGATDANLLSNPQVASKLLENAPNLKDILKKAESGGASAAMAGTLPPGGATDALAQLAAHAEQKGAELGGLLGMGMGAYSSGGGGGNSGGSKSDNPFSLFGAGAGGSAAAGSGTQLTTFGSVPSVMDIWHTGTTQNIFEIVSDKMSKVSNRVTTSTK